MVVEQEITRAFTGGMFTALVALGILTIIVAMIAVYIYYSLALMTIAKKLKYKRPWLAWIPIANIAMMLEIGGFAWQWIFLILVPFLGWAALFVLFIISSWNIFEKRKYPGWFSLSILIPQAGVILYGIALGFVAWKDKKRK